MVDVKTKYGPWAIVTGASEGTGSAFAHRLADDGVNCILIARREGPLEDLGAAIRAKGVECVTASIDLSSGDATDRIVAAVGDREVGLLIANAGADGNNLPFLDARIGNWDELVVLNVLTTMRNCHHFGAAMRARKRGGIIIVGSGAGYGGLNGIAVYCGVKAFDLAFGEGLWAELRHDGVDVLNLMLGRTNTPAHRRLIERAGGTFHGETMARPDDIARVALERLPYGPTFNWGEGEDTVGMAPNSPAARRARILAIEQMTKVAASK